jgi:hypothetical protein
MGMLDDAIRQHLELKRRRGADPAEIERAEREALGPVRRLPQDPDQAANDETAASLGPDAGLGRGQSQADAELYGDEEDWDDDPFEDEAEAFAEEPELFEDEEPFAEPGREQDDPDLGAPTQVLQREPLEPEPPEPERARSEEREPPAPPAVPPPHPAGPGGDEPGRPPEDTAEYDVGEANREPGEQEDVLEETPEFLQDTPDHDRLWFEQRPPRDFDFDG